MKYKFTLTSILRNYMEWQLRHYHEDKRQLEEYKNEMIPSCTPNYQADAVNSGTTSDPTGAIGIRIATNPYILSTERSIRAIDRTLERCDKIDMKLIELVYWKQSHTLPGAAMEAHIEKTSAYDRINRILYGIALELGAINIK